MYERELRPRPPMFRPLTHHYTITVIDINRSIKIGYFYTKFQIYIDELTSIDDTAMSVHSIACRVLAVAERVAGNAVFVCMLVEGIYLHRLIVAVFRQKLNVSLLYGIGAGW